MSPGLWNDCVDLIPTYREMKEQKKTDEWIDEICDVFLKKYPGADSLPSGSSFRTVRAKPSPGMCILNVHREYAIGSPTRDGLIETRRKSQ